MTAGINLMANNKHHTFGGVDYATLPNYPMINMPVCVGLRVRFGPPVEFVPNSRRYPAPPTQDPLTRFTPMINTCSYPGPRWVQFDPASKRYAVLLFTDGVALDNMCFNAQAGCGIAVRPDGQAPILFPLERVGPAQTSNCAKLPAAHAALILRVWSNEGFGRIVVATDSEYVVNGVSEWVARWRRNGWKNSAGHAIANKDLWLMMFEAIESLEAEGLIVQFYLIQPRYNLANSLARKGAMDMENIFSEWLKIKGVAM